MKHLSFKLLLATLLCPLFLTSCSDDDENEGKVNVLFSAIPKVEGVFPISLMEGAEVAFTEVRNQNTHKFPLDASGKAQVQLTRGTYNISIEKTIKYEDLMQGGGNNSSGMGSAGDDVVVSLRMENVSIANESQEVNGYLSTLPQSALGKDIIFSEIFFNGETNSGRMMHPDQYFVLFNPTEEVLYADGISVGVTMHLSWQEKRIWYDEFYQDRIPIGGFVTIPGSGKDHPIAPGGRLVVAFTAIDHSSVEGYDNAVDLRGADFEIYYGPNSSDIDNPNVPNLILTENEDSYGFFLHPRGYVSPLMFRLPNGEESTIKAFVESHTVRSKTYVEATETTPAGEIDINILYVPASEVLDAVQTSDVPQDIKTRVIPEVLDRGKFLVTGCHRQELCIRKEIKVGNKTFYQDTNNSSDDIVMRKGQTSFGPNWRNN